MKTLIIPMYHNNNSASCHLLLLPFDKPQAREMLERSRKALLRRLSEESFSHEAYRLPKACVAHYNRVHAQASKEGREMLHYNYDAFPMELDDAFIGESQNLPAKKMLATYDSLGSLGMSCDLPVGATQLRFKSRWLYKATIGDIAKQLGEA